jgi:GNAT superfamily N-acetyltransferase
MIALRHRGFDGDEDFWRVRRFLVDAAPRAAPGVLWDVRRWDGSYFHADTPGLDAAGAARTRIWEDAAGRVVAAALSEGDDELHPLTDPGLRCLEPEVLEWAESNAARLGAGAVRVLCYDHDAFRRALLERRGYERSDSWAAIRRLRPGACPLPEPEMPEGYLLRTTRDDPADRQRIADLLNAAFGRDFHHGAELATFQAGAPSYRRDLDLVAEAPGGGFAAYTAACWDEANRVGIFEPVCTHPDHRRRGLAAALMGEGLRRVRDLGAAAVHVETGDMEPANALYRSLPFTEEHIARVWTKLLAPG